MSLQAQAAKSLGGRHIYAYCNVRTNQVLYTLEPQLKKRHLKQLPDLGANNKPAEIRGDLWQPLWRFDMPEREGCDQQGRDIFRKLREWRVLREHNTPKVERPSRTADEVKLQERLDERGGSKKENVEKLKIRMDKKARIKSIMDQKANSVADLSAVLFGEQERITKLAEKDRARIARRAVGVAYDYADRLRVDEITQEMLEKKRQIKMPLDEFKQAFPKKSKMRFRRRLDLLQRKLAEIPVAIPIREGLEEPDRRQFWEENVKGKEYYEVPESPNWQARSLGQWRRFHQLSKKQHIAKQADDDDYREKFEKFMAKPHKLVWGRQGTSYDHFLASEMIGPVAEHMFAQADPISRYTAQFNLDGARIAWVNTLDKEYAAQWPEGVEHSANVDDIQEQLAKELPNLSAAELFYITERPVYQQLANISPDDRQQAIQDLLDANEADTPLRSELLQLSEMAAETQYQVLFEMVAMPLDDRLESIMRRREVWMQAVQTWVEQGKTGSSYDAFKQARAAPRKKQDQAAESQPVETPVE